MNYQRDTTYYQHNLAVTENDAVSTAQTFNFYSFFFKGIQVTGQCDAWQKYFENSLTLPFDFLSFVNLKAIIRTYNFDDLNAETVMGKNYVSVTCTDPNIISSLLNAFKTGLYYEKICGGYSWRVFTCKTRRIMCVNCKYTCVESEACPSRSLIINPCMSGCDTVHGTSSVVISATYARKKLYPQFRESLNVVANSKNSFLVKANITAPGNVYCRAVYKGTSVDSISDIMVQSGSGRSFTTDISATSIVSVPILNLDPDTQYDVYCYTSDYNNRIMDFSDTLSFKVSGIKTLCCRQIKFTKTLPTQIVYIPGSRIPEVPFEFAIDAPPSIKQSVSIKHIAVSCDKYRIPVQKSLARVSISPQNFTFTSKSASLTGSFLVRSYDQVCLKLIASASGSDYYTPTQFNLTVTGYNVPPLSPVITSVRMSDSGLSLLVSFDRNTDKGAKQIPAFASSFPCDALFEMKSANKSVCMWPTNSTLNIQFSAGLFDAKANVGDAVTLLAGKVTNPCAPTQDCTRLQYAARQTVQISPPLAPVAPLVVLSVPNKISACDVIKLDPSGSVGNAGRPWTSAVWEVVAYSVKRNDSFGQPVDVEGNIMTEITKAYLDGDLTNIAIIPNNLLAVGGKYSFKLEVTNFLGQSGVSTAVVTVGSSTAIPTVNLAGVTNALSYRWQEANFFASAALPACAGSAALKTSLEYSWKLYKDVIYEQSILSTSKDPRYFKVAPYSLSAQTTYTIQVVVTVPTPNGLNPIQSSASATFQTGTSGVIARISGGLLQTVSLSFPLTLDASTSYDIDYPLEPKRLSYVWTCSEMSPVFGNLCPGFKDALLIKNKDKLLYPSNTLLGGSTYNFTVTVQSTSGAVATISSLVTVSVRSVPRVSILNVDAKYNPSSKITLTGNIVADPAISGNAGVTAKWSSVDGTTNVASISLSPSNWDSYNPISATYVTPFQLSIAPDTLTGGLTYQFQLSARYLADSKSESVAYVSILMNSPPKGGMLSISPASGYGLNQTFTFQSTKWIDDVSDLPLQYTFSYYNPISGGARSVFRSKNEVPVARGVLGAGVEVIRGNIQAWQQNGVVTCYDIYGAENEVEAAVIVQKMPVSSSETALQSILAYQLNNAAVAKDASRAAAVMSSVLAALNEVDCSESITGVYYPEGDSDYPNFCSKSYNRQPCSKTPLTCGPCQSGYMGKPGDANSKCSQISGPKRRRLSSFKSKGILTYNEFKASSVGVFSIGGAKCSVNSDCASGICSVAKVCGELYKECPTDGNAACSGGDAGKCVATDTRLNLQVPSCLAQDPYCTVKCECKIGRYGSNCAIFTAQKYNNRRTLIDSMCSSLKANIQIEDINADVILNRGNTVSNLFRDMTLVSSSALSDCTDVLVSTVSENLSFLGGADIAEVYTGAFSSILSINPPDALLQDVYDSISLIAQACQARLAIGEIPYEVTLDNVRYVAAMSNKLDMQGKSFSIPLTPYEVANNVSVSNVQFEDISAPTGTGSGGVGIMIVQYTNNPTRVLTNSTSVTVQATRYGSVRRRLLSRRSLTSSGLVSNDYLQRKLVGLSDLIVTTVLRNAKPIDYVVPPIYHSYVKCNVRVSEATAVAAGASAVPESTSGMCYSSQYSAICPGVRGYFNNTCPSYTKLPMCTSWNGVTNAFEKNDCAVVSYDTYRTTCECGRPPVRKLLESASNNSISDNRFQQEESQYGLDPYSSVDSLYEDDIHDASQLSRSLLSTTFSIHLSSTYSIDSTPFIENWYPAPPLVLVEQNQVLISTLSFVVIVFFSGLVFFGAWDFKELSWAKANAKKSKLPLVKKKSELLKGSDADMDDEAMSGFDSKPGFVEPSENPNYRSIKAFFSKVFPEEFNDGRWYELYQKRLSIEHSWFCLIAPYREDRQLRVVKFTISMANLITFLFMTTILAIQFFRDDGTCENIEDFNSCNAKSSILGLRTFCYYNNPNDYCMFVAPVLDFFTLLSYTLVVTTAGVPLRKFLEYMIEKVSQRNPHRQHKNKQGKHSKPGAVVPDANSVQSDSEVQNAGMLTMEEIADLPNSERKQYDEFRQAQSLRSTLMRAARLDKAQKSMDFVLPAEESALIMLQQEADTQRYKNHMIFKNRADNFSFRQMRYGFENAKFEHVKRIVTNAREEADLLKLELELMHTEEEREVFLMKHFFVNYFQGYTRLLVNRYMLGRFESVRNSYFRAARKYFFMLLLPAMLGGMIYFIYIYQVALGSRSTTMWLAITIISLFQDVVLLQPIRIWMRWIFINAMVAQEVRDVVFNFRDRCRIILMRPHGLMRDSNALVQHFNPACRAARMFPELPISRVLMTVGDFDIPSIKKRSFVGASLYALANVFLVLVFLPITLQDTVFELLVTAGTNTAILGLWEYASISMAGAILIVVIAIGLVLSRESIILWIAKRRAAIARKKANENMFYEVAEETLEDLKAFEDDDKMDGSVYLNEMDMASPNVVKNKPQSSEKLQISPGGYTAGTDDNLDQRLDLRVTASPAHTFSPEQPIRPMWAATTIHNLQESLGSEFIGKAASYETNRTILPIKGPPIAASNKRIYGPEIQAQKQSPDGEMVARPGTLPPLKPTPTLLSIIQANATLFTGAETARRSLPDDDDDGDSTGPYARPLGKKKQRKDQKKLGRSRKRSQEREQRLRAQEGPGSGRKDVESAPLYFDELQVKEAAEAAAAAEAAGDEPGDIVATESEREPDGYGANPREGSRRKHDREHRRRKHREERGHRSGRSSERDSEREGRTHRSRSRHRHSDSDTSRSDVDYEVREDPGAKARRKQKSSRHGKDAQADGPGSMSRNVLDGGTYTAVELMQIQADAVLPNVDYLAGIAEGPDEDKSVANN